MRPLRLELKGFTAFREPTELDLTDLDVFAVSGPTGSGKSSLLDAMTYALYGRVERVGDRVSQLISQGQPRMAVSLEFQVGHDRYKVTRSTPAGRGATKIQLMRLVDGEWIQAGEGSDRVRDVERRLAAIIGLTYDGFTRSVLLPQGKFAEFMVGDPRKRREILTELLGHELFKRMAERAGSIAREATVRAETLTGVLGQEYADAAPEALADAKRAAKEAARREQALSAAAEQVIEILGRWSAAQRTLEELTATAAEAGREAAQAAASSEELAELADRLQRAAEQSEALAARAEAAEEAVQAAGVALETADATLGSPSALAKAHAWAEALSAASRGLASASDRRDRSAAEASALAEALDRSARALAQQEAGLAAREAAVGNAEASLEEARHADLVTAVSRGLRAGDPCPVCGLPLAKAPKQPATGALDRATAMLEAARKDLDQARTALREAERAVDRTRQGVDANADEQARLAADAETFELQLTAETERLQPLLGEPLPEDPAAEVERRLAERHRLDQAEREATRDAANSAQAVLKAEQETNTVAGLVERHRDRLAVDRQPLFDRAAKLVGKPAAGKIPAPPDSAETADLQRYASDLATVMTTLEERLAVEIRERASLEERLLEEAQTRVGGLVEPVPTLEGLAEAVNAACRTATAESATSARRAEEIAARLDGKKQLLAEVQQHEVRSRLFKVLAQELRADRIISFLQVEALQLLAAAGSERLASVSDGRYRLVCHDDEFSVVDTWNGDEERSVRTLSGGETFLASLALALALADQVRSISVTDRARLDSLFLDEGFGTLDPDSLRTVTEAIERLGGDGRLVGVITHVKELAEQFPRVEVTKSPAGSHLELVP